MPPKGRQRKPQGAPNTASSKKRAKQSASKKQVPILSLLVLEHSFEQDLESDNQAMDLNGLVGVMSIFVDISSRLQD